MKKKIFSALAAILIIILILLALQGLVMPKYVDNPEGNLTREYYSQMGDNDVIFVGDCEVYEGFVPSVLWEKYGITAYVRGSPQQLVWQSYYLLREMMRHETPKVVVFNVLALKYGEPQSEPFNRMTLEQMRPSADKAEAISASMLHNEEVDESMLDYIFPLLRYHSRITELTSDDFKYWFSQVPRQSDGGYLMQTAIRPMQKKAESPRELADYTLPASSMEYLDKMRELCRENSCELVLVKSPTNSWGYWWYDEWEEQICDYAEKNGLAYYNFIPLCDKIGIDWSRDTYDEGVHLNVYGAEKLSEYFGRILAEKHGVADRRSDPQTAQKRNEYLKIYKERKKSMEEQDKK